VEQSQAALAPLSFVLECRARFTSAFVVVALSAMPSDVVAPAVNDLGLDPQLQVKVAPILAGIRDKCLRMGKHGFDLLRRKVSARDSRVQTRMDPDKFRLALLDLGIVLSGQDIKFLTLGFKDGQGYLRVNMLCDHICGFLSQERAHLVDGIFDLLDVDHSGELNIDDLRQVADFQRHSAVLAGKLTAEEAMRQYLDIFDTDTPDGQITRDEFRAYYAGVSETCPTLEFFEEVVKSAWKFLDLSKLAQIKHVRKSQRSTPADAAGTVGGATSTFGGTLIPPRAAVQSTISPMSPDKHQASKRVVGYTGHVPMAKERFGETFHKIDSSTPELSQADKEIHYGAKYVDEKNAFVKSGNKSNAHSFKMA
jgi:Ca2+-binding EF-hand superfamily protein